MEKYENVRRKLEEKGCYEVSITYEGIYVSWFPTESMIPFKVIDDIIEYHGEEYLIDGIYDILLKNK